MLRRNWVLTSFSAPHSSNAAQQSDTTMNSIQLTHLINAAQLSNTTMHSIQLTHLMQLMYKIQSCIQYDLSDQCGQCGLRAQYSQCCLSDQCDHTILVIQFWLSEMHQMRLYVLVFGHTIMWPHVDATTWRCGHTKTRLCDDATHIDATIPRHGHDNVATHRYSA